MPVKLRVKVRCVSRWQEAKDASQTLSNTRQIADAEFGIVIESIRLLKFVSRNWVIWVIDSKRSWTSSVAPRRESPRPMTRMGLPVPGVSRVARFFMEKTRARCGRVCIPGKWCGTKQNTTGHLADQGAAFSQAVQLAHFLKKNPTVQGDWTVAPLKPVRPVRYFPLQSFSIVRQTRLHSDGCSAIRWWTMTGHDARDNLFW